MLEESLKKAISCRLTFKSIKDQPSIFKSKLVNKFDVVGKLFGCSRSLSPHVFVELTSEYGSTIKRFKSTSVIVKEKTYSVSKATSLGYGCVVTIIE